MSIQYPHLKTRIPSHLTHFLVLLFIAGFTTCLTAAELGNLTPEQLMEKQNALVIDIRTSKEWTETGTIPKSHKLEFFDEKGKFDSADWLNQLEQLKESPEQPVILICRSGNRSEIVGNFLAKKKGMQDIYHLQEGIKSWIKAGKELQK